jgi:hypothetical protein
MILCEEQFFLLSCAHTITKIAIGSTEPSCNSEIRKVMSTASVGTLFNPKGRNNMADMPNSQVGVGR